jgi:predicted dehydrogenase
LRLRRSSNESPILSKEGVALSSPRRFRVAILGTGGIAETGHIPALLAQAHRVELVAAVDVDPGRLKEFTRRHGIAAGYESLDSMLVEQCPDLVLVCSPPASHADAVLRILNAGSWALVEKPPTLSLAEYHRIEQAERDGGPYASVVYQHRFGSGALRLARQTAAGELGRALVAQCDTSWFRGPEYYDVPWRGKWATEGGGPTMGHGIHQMDLLLAVLGDWVEVRAMAGRLDRAVETEDVSLALVRFASGALATIVNSVLSPREESRLRFDFTDATVELRHLYGYSDANWVYTPAPHVAQDVERVRGWTRTGAGAGESGGSGSGSGVVSSHAAQLPYVLDAMERGVRPPMSGPTGREALELITALYRAAFTGRPVLRGEIGPDDPFYHRMHGDVAGWAPGPDGESAGMEGEGQRGARLERLETESVLSVSAGDGEILRYHYRPQIAALECPSPYFHPLRTLGGGIVTGNRPSDHRWHKGLAMTTSHLSGQNFWGGGTYVHRAPGPRYVDLPNVGRIEHKRFEGEAGDEGMTTGARARFVEELDWITAKGERWIREQRAVSVRDVDPVGGSWALEFSTELHNVRGESLDFGSPTVFGRELAGYCGFFWRGPRAFAGGAVRSSGGREGQRAAMGHTSPWLAFTGEFDERDGFATLLFVPDPANRGGDPYWFVRSEPFAAVNPSLAFYETLELADDDVLRMRYRLVIADGDWDHARIEAYVEAVTW